MPEDAGIPTLKGTLKDAQLGVDKLISRAFNLRKDPIKMVDGGIPEPVTIEQVEAQIRLESQHEFSFQTTTIQKKLYAHYTFNECTDEWCKKVKQIFDPFDCLTLRPIVNDICQRKAEILYKILRARLSSHINRRIAKEEKRDHWTFDFVRQNLARVAMIMVTLDHVQDDLETLLRQDNRCLLRNLSAHTDKFLMLEGTDMGKKMEGSYLYFDSSASVWIRSGKVCGRTFDIRHAEHAKGATLPDRKSLKSNSYASYPNREAVLDTSEMRLGYFNNLSLRCAIGYSRSKQGTIAELASSADGSLFHWDGPVLKKVEKLNFKQGSKNTEER